MCHPTAFNASRFDSRDERELVTFGVLWLHTNALSFALSSLAHATLRVLLVYHKKCAIKSLHTTTVLGLNIVVTLAYLVSPLAINTQVAGRGHNCDLMWSINIIGVLCLLFDYKW